MSDGFKITGNWDFDGKKKIDAKDYDATKLQASAKNSKFKDKVNFSDGINKNEAKYIVTEFEKEGFVDFDDFDITNADIKKFLKNNGLKGNAQQVKEMKTVVNSIANTYMEANQTAKVKESYTSVQDIYLTGGNPNSNIAISPSKINSQNTGAVTQTVTAPGANKTNNPQQGSNLKELINNAYALNDVAKNNGLKDTEGVLHNLVDEYLQSNPELSARISELNGGKNIKDLSYNQILNTSLFKEDETVPFKVIAPTYNMPTPKGASTIPENMKVTQKQYSTENSKVDIISNKNELGENQYANVTDAIASQYGLDKKDSNYQNALKTIAFQVANDPRNAKTIETYINSLPKDKAAQYMNDNSRVDALLAAKDIQGLYLPDNVLENSIRAQDGKKYTYTNGSKIYQLSPLSPVDGQPAGKIKLATTFNGKETAGSVSNLEDILKYSQDPRTGQALATLNEKGEVVSNIKDEAAQGMATAYMMNSIKDNPSIFAASQEIDGKFQMFGAYEIKDKKVLGKMNELLDAAKADGLSNEDAAAQVRKKLIKQFGDADGDGKGKLEDFLEKYASVNLENAKNIDFYDENGNIRFKNADGTPVTYKVSETYVRFGTAKAVSNNSTVGLPSTTPSARQSTTSSTEQSTTSSSSSSTTPSTTSSTTTSTHPSATPSNTTSSTKPSMTPSTSQSTTPSIKPSTTPSSTTPPSTTPSNPPSTTPSTTSSTTTSTHPSATPSNTTSSTKPSMTPSTSQSTTPSIKPSTTPSSTTPPSTTPSNPPSTTPSTVVSTTPSSTTPSSATPSSAPSTAPSFNPTQSVTEPKDPTPSTNPIPSSTPSTAQSSEPVTSSCLPPPPPSNSTTSTATDAAQQAASNASQSNTEEAPASFQSHENNVITATTDSSANTVINELPPPPPPSAPYGGMAGDMTADAEQGYSQAVENKVGDNTSEAIKNSDDIEKRRVN